MSPVHFSNLENRLKLSTVKGVSETDLITAEQANLTVTLEELSKFVLIGRDKLQAVRTEINAIKKLGVAREVREQKLVVVGKAK